METYYKNLVWIGIPQAVYHGLVDPEEMLETVRKFKKFKEFIKNQWPEDRVRKWHKDQINKRIDLYKKSIERIERENKDSRIGGVPYKDRISFTVKIEKLDNLIENCLLELKKTDSMSYNWDNIISPLDVPFIRKTGVEKHLLYYFELSTC
ncbi:MAG TPA: hypothetical protein DCZ03_15105 [Gammaproteobacteria bacterium]|nr:hypothetical protein [Gammaproteobacteria bacterium]